MSSISPSLAPAREAGLRIVLLRVAYARSGYGVPGTAPEALHRGLPRTST